MESHAAEIVLARGRAVGLSSMGCRRNIFWAVAGGVLNGCEGIDISSKSEGWAAAYCLGPSQIGLDQ